MFQHPALRKNTRGRSFGDLPTYHYVVVKTPADFNFARALDSALNKLRPALNAANQLPAGSILLVETAFTSINDYRILAANGHEIGLDTTSNQFGVLGGADEFEDFLDDRGNMLFKVQIAERNALSRAQDAYDAAVRERAGGGSSSSAAPATTSAPAASTVATAEDVEQGKKNAKTGYYEGNRVGVAVYYNAANKYIEWLSAPPSEGLAAQPRFKAGEKEYENFWKYYAQEALAGRNLYKGSDRAARNAALAIATAPAEGGKELPEPGRSGGSSSSYTPSTASSPTAPSTTAPAKPASGTPAPATGGKKGVPAWVWWTSGTVVVAGLGVWGAIALKKRNEANQ
jgi:hypothetical protein